MFKKFYCVVIGEEKLFDAICKLNEFDIKVLYLEKLAGENDDCWCLGFRANKKHWRNFLTYIRIERIVLKK